MVPEKEFGSLERMEMEGTPRTIGFSHSVLRIFLYIFYGVSPRWTPPPPRISALGSFSLTSRPGAAAPRPWGPPASRKKHEKLSLTGFPFRVGCGFGFLKKTKKNDP